jgi:hypothetical protein
MMTTYHPDLASGRWFTLSLACQLGNAGSEYERALQSKKRGDKVRFDHAFNRLLELMEKSSAQRVNALKGSSVRRTLQ